MGNGVKQALLFSLSSHPVRTPILYCKPQTGHCTPDAASDVLIMGDNNFHVSSALAVAARDAVGHHHHKSTLVIHDTILSTHPPGPFLHSLYACMAYFIPREGQVGIQRCYLNKQKNKSSEEWTHMRHVNRSQVHVFHPSFLMWCQQKEE